MKFKELNTRRGDLRDAERDVAIAKRELIPLTTGLISDVKRKRTANMRNAIRLKKKSILKIQVHHFFGEQKKCSSFVMHGRLYGAGRLSGFVCVWIEILYILMISSFTGQFVLTQLSRKSPFTIM